MTSTQHAAEKVLAAAMETDPRNALGPTRRPVPSFPDPEPLSEHGPARIVAVCNQKGGVGKTTTTINLGAALAEQGRRVLLVDFDPQGALSVGLGQGDPRQLEMTVHNLLLERGTEWEDILLETSEKVQARINPDLVIDGFLGTMYDSRTLHTREVLSRVVEAFGEKVFHTVINRTVRFPDATVVGEPITTFDSSSMGASAYRELAKEVLERWRLIG